MEIAHRVKQNNRKNVINFSIKTESKAHYLKKAEVCYYLKLLKEPFWTEGKINVRSRPDIFVINKEVAIEILDSEKESNLEVKAKKYGCPVRGVRVIQEIGLDFVEKLIN